MSKYVIATLRILGTNKNGLVEAVITYKLYVVNRLDTNILVGTDIILPKKIDILLLDKILRISTYNVNILV
jgi:hypothetical protein